MKSNDLPLPLIRLLADIFELGSKHDAREETVAVIKLLKHVRPAAPALTQIEAWHLIELRQFFAARELLEAADSAHVAEPITKAMLVMCLYLQGDSLWQSYAAQVRELPGNEEAMAMVAAIEDLARDTPAGTQSRQYA